MDVLSRTRNIVYRHNWSALTDYQAIYTPEIIDPLYKAQGYKYSGYITDLRLNCKVNSITEAKLPQIPLGASKTDKMELIRDFEYSNSHFIFNLGLTTSQDVVDIATISLQNRKPHYQINLLNYITDQPSFVISPDSQLSIRFQDDGYGIPDNTDEFVIYGTVVEETTVLPESTVITTMDTYNRNGVTLVPTKILNANPARKNVLFRNILEHDVYIGYTSQMAQEQGILLKEGWFYEMNLTNMFKGDIWALPKSGVNNPTGQYRLVINEMS